MTALEEKKQRLESIIESVAKVRLGLESTVGAKWTPWGEAEMCASQLALGALDLVKRSELLFRHELRLISRSRV